MTKKYVNWESIETAYKAGGALRELATAHGITHPAIIKRAERDGWQPYRRAAGLGYIPDDPMKQRFIGELAQIGGEHWAILKTGISRAVLQEWRDTDEAFDAAHDQATLHHLEGLVADIGAAAASGQRGAATAFKKWSKVLARRKSEIAKASEPVRPGAPAKTFIFVERVRR